MLNRLHHFLAGWRLAVLAALKVRNQCAAVVAYRLAPSPDPEANGELWLARTFGSETSTFVDVGAHRGHWTAMLLEHAAAGAKGLLFEPNGDLVPGLRERFAANTRVELSPLALGAAAGEMPFRVDPVNGERSHLVGSARAAGDRQVAVSTLDVEIEKRGWPHVDLLKIDAEGQDFHVLRGAARLLSAGRLGVIQFEYGDAWPAASATLLAAIEFLKVHGYETFLLQPGGLEPPRYERWGEHFSYSNYVAVAPALRAKAGQWVRR